MSIIKDIDFKLLQNRILYLSVNYPLRILDKSTLEYSQGRCLYGGIFYNYPLIDNFDCLKELDIFYHQILNSKCFFKINSILTSNQIKELKKYSFFIGFNRHIIRKFKLEDLNEITKCWKE